MSSQEKFEDREIMEKSDFKPDEAGSKSEDSDRGSGDKERTHAACDNQSDLDDAGHKFLTEGQVIGGKYRIVRKLGSGGMSVVYMANDLAIDRAVAVKTLRSSRINDEKSVRRFQQEGKAVGRLSHPNIVCVHDIGVTESGEPYLVMDFAEGTTLADRLGFAGRFEPVRALEIVSGVLDALIHAHEKGVVHRDLKPGNIIVFTGTDNKEHIKVFDFGIAKLMPEGDKPSSDLTQTGEVFGSPLYMSPEQCLGKPLDGRADIYSLGCILFEIIAGYPPHRAPTSVETIIKHVQENPETIKQACPDLNLPERLEALLVRALQKDPDLRFQSATEMKQSIAALLEEMTTFEPHSSVASTATAVLSSKFGQILGKDRSSLLFPGVIVFALVVLTGLLCWLIGGSTEPAKTPEIRTDLGLGAIGNMTDEAQRQTTAQFAPESLKPIIAHKGIISFGLTNDQIDDTTAARLSNSKNYHEVNFDNCTIRLTKVGLSYFDNLPIYQLSLLDAKFDREFLRHVCSIPTLRTLTLDGDAIDRESMEIIAGCSDLEVLSLSRSIESDAALEPVKRLTKLKVLRVAGCRLSDKSIDTILQCKNLEELDFSDEPWSNDSLRRLGGLKHLTNLSLRGSHTGDSQMTPVLALNGLTLLDLRATQITDEGLIKLARLRNLSKLRIDHCDNLTNAGVRRLQDKRRDLRIERI